MNDFFLAHQSFYEHFLSVIMSAYLSKNFDRYKCTFFLHQCQLSLTQSNDEGAKLSNWEALNNN